MNGKEKTDGPPPPPAIVPKPHRPLSQPHHYPPTPTETVKGTFVANGTFAVDTGKFTGRSPKDKWIVKQAPSEKNLWWGSVNQPLDGKAFDELYAKCIAHYNTLDKAYVFDGYCGASPASRKKARLFIRPSVHLPIRLALRWCTCTQT